MGTRKIAAEKYQIKTNGNNQIRIFPLSANKMVQRQFDFQAHRAHWTALKVFAHIVRATKMAFNTKEIEWEGASAKKTQTHRMFHCSMSLFNCEKRDKSQMFWEAFIHIKTYKF